jgi:hypothetical protein
MAKKHMKIYSPSLATKEMKIKTTLRFNSFLMERPTSRTHQQQMLARMWEKMSTHTLLVGMYPSATTLENIMEAS